MSLPLQRLPILALDQVVKLMDIQDIVHLIELSRKTNRCLKWSTKLVEIRLEICNKRDAKYIIYEKIKKPVVSALGVACRQLCFDSFEYKVRKESEFIKIIDFFEENFKIKYASVRVEVPSSRHAHKMIDHMNKLGVKLKYVIWSDMICDSDQARTILTSSANASGVLFWPRVDGFKFEGFHKFSMNSLNIIHGSWITLENICAMRKIRKIELNGLKLSCENFNEILKKWQSCELNFGSMYLSYKNDDNIDIEEILDGVQVETRRPGNYRIRQVDENNLAKLKINEWGVLLRVIT